MPLGWLGGRLGFCFGVFGYLETGSRSAVSWSDVDSLGRLFACFLLFVGLLALLPNSQANKVVGVE